MDNTKMVLLNRLVVSVKPELWTSRPKSNDKPGPLSFLRNYIFPLLAILFFYLIFDALIARVYVENISMEPTLQPGDYLMVIKDGYHWGKMKQGDIIIFNRSEEENKQYIKRIIGLPGDDILMQNGTLYANGQSIDESYLVTQAFYNGYWQVDSDEVFVLGDNRNLSIDSHNWADGNGVPITDIIGKAIFIYWPINKVKVIK